MTPSLLTVKDMATRLQVKDKTVYAWASQGKIPCVKVNGVIRFDAKEIEHWLQQCHVPMDRLACQQRTCVTGPPPA